MEEKILKYRKQIIGAIAFSLIAVMVIAIAPVSFLTVNAQEEGDDVSVEAGVAAWLGFTVETTLDMGDLVDSSGDTHLGQANVEMDIGTNNSNGWYVTMAGGNDCDADGGPDNGSCDSGASYLYGSNSDFAIPSVSERNTITAGGSDDLYGALVEPLKTESADWDPDSTPRGTPTITEVGDDTEGSESGYYWEEVVDGSSGGAGPIPYNDATEIVNCDLPHDTTSVANFHVRAAATSMTPSDDYTDTITLTALGGVD